MFWKQRNRAEGSYKALCCIRERLPSTCTLWWPICLGNSVVAVLFLSWAAGLLGDYWAAWDTSGPYVFHACQSQITLLRFPVWLLVLLQSESRAATTRFAVLRWVCTVTHRISKEVWTCSLCCQGSVYSSLNWRVQDPHPITQQLCTNITHWVCLLTEYLWY